MSVTAVLEVAGALAADRRGRRGNDPETPLRVLAVQANAFSQTAAVTINPACTSVSS